MLKLKLIENAFKNVARFCIVFVLVSMLLSTGCSSSRILNAKLITNEDLNPNRHGLPSPLAVHFYQLKQEGIFKQVNFIQLYQNPKSTLGDSLIEMKNLYLLPDQTQKLKWNLDKETKYIGIVAEYRQLERSQWRMVLPVKSISNRKTKFQFTKDSVKQDKK